MVVICFFIVNLVEQGLGNYRVWKYWNRKFATGGLREKPHQLQCLLEEDSKSSNLRAWIWSGLKYWTVIGQLLEPPITTHTRPMSTLTSCLIAPNIELKQKLVVSGIFQGYKTTTLFTLNYTGFLWTPVLSTNTIVFP